MDLKIITWNCRRLSNPCLNSWIRNLMACLKPNYLCLVETKANTLRISHFCSKYSRWCYWVAIPSSGLFGENLVLWNKSVGFVTPVVFSRMALHLIITSNNRNWVLSIIYNSHTFSEQKLLWRSLHGFSLFNTPCLLTGDFISDEHIGGTFNHYASKSSYFNKFIFDSALIDLGFSGSKFT